MKNVAFIIIVLVSCVNFGCEQDKFKTVQGKKAAYSISIPKDFNPTPDDYPIRYESQDLDLRYQNSNGESILIAAADIPIDDASNYLKQFATLSNLELIQKLDANGEFNLKILERKVIDVNGIPSYFVYYRSDKLFYQLLYQFNDGKMIKISCAYDHKEYDSLMQYYYQVVNSIVWE